MSVVMNVYVLIVRDHELRTDYSKGLITALNVIGSGSSFGLLNYKSDGGIGMSKKTVSQNHLHKYKKVDIGRNGNEYLVYLCTKPYCSHYMPLHMAIGKACECNRCGAEMVITHGVMFHSSNKPMTRPHCPNCTKRKSGSKANAAAAIEAFLKGT